MPNDDPWLNWLASDEGKRCADAQTLLTGREPGMFLRNRLWWAFQAGFIAGEKKSSQIANSEPDTPNGPE